MNWKLVFLLSLFSVYSITLVHAEEDAPHIFDGTTDSNLTELPTNNLILRDNASLIIQNIHLETIFYNSTEIITITLYDNSNLIIINSSIPASIELYNSSKVEVRDSTILHAYWCRIHNTFHNSSGIFTHDYSSFNVSDSKLGYIRSDGENIGQASTVNVMELWASGGVDSSLNLYAENCNIGRVHLTNPPNRLTGIRAGYYENLILNQQTGVSIKLHKSELKEGLSLTFQDSTINVDNCDIYVLDAVNCSRITVSDSIVWDLVVWEIGDVELVNCSVDYFSLLNNDVCEVVLDHCWIGRFDGFASSFYRLFATDSVIDYFYQGRMVDMTLNGVSIELQEWNSDVEYLSIEGVFDLENGSLPVLVLRNGLNANISVSKRFPVLVRQMIDPVEDALIEVLDGDKVLASARTGRDGYADIQLRFFEGYMNVNNGIVHETNLTNIYTLRVSVNEFTNTQTISVYTVTPISVEVQTNNNKTVLTLIAIFCILISIILLGKIRD